VVGVGHVPLHPDRQLFVVVAVQLADREDDGRADEAGE